MNSSTGQTASTQFPHAWLQDWNASITVTDIDGRILEMNAESARHYADFGGAGLVGQNMLACHPEPARSKVQEQLRSGQTHIYTVEKAGRKKLVYQAPWHHNGQYAGMVEMILPLPGEVPHFVRKE